MLNPRDRIRSAIGSRSIRGFARLHGLSHVRIIQILKGDRITYDMALKLAPALKCSPKSLFEERTAHQSGV